MGLLAEAVISQVRTEVIENRVFRAVGEQIKIEASRKPPDVDPAVGTLRSIWVNRRITKYELIEKKQDDPDTNSGSESHGKRKTKEKRKFGFKGRGGERDKEEAVSELRKEKKNNYLSFTSKVLSPPLSP